MGDNTIVFSEDLTIRMLKIRFANEKLFKSKKQPWVDFYNLLMEKGFPSEISLGQVRKKWGYLLDTYRGYKKENNPKSFKYCKLFDKHFGKCEAVDKYETWPESWRLKLAICVSETIDLLGNTHKEQKEIWRTVEKAMRIQNLPEDCCVQDIKGLWRHINTIFRRQYRRLSRKDSGETSSWPLYDTMLAHYKRHEAHQLLELQSDGPVGTYKRHPRIVDKWDDGNEFQWSTDITESFIQIRLQNDHMFYGKGQPWLQFTRDVLHQEHGFPTTLSARNASRKWQQTFADYQKAKATNFTAWQYYNLFEAYLGEGSLSLNPLLDWKEKWVIKLINARAKHNQSFLQSIKDQSRGWREVEKELRRDEIPLEYSLLELNLLWDYLLRMFKWKKKFAKKGVLKEQWPYFQAMAKCVQIMSRRKLYKKEIEGKYMVHSNISNVTDGNVDAVDDNIGAVDDNIGAVDDYIGAVDDDDDDDDIKLFDLKQKMEVEVKPCLFDGMQCRACGVVADGVNMFEHVDDEGVDFASKLLVICGVEVEKTGNLPTQICNVCLVELENAYKFRRKCQNANDQFREYSNKNMKIKIEMHEANENMDIVFDGDDATNCGMDDVGKYEEVDEIDNQTKATTKTSLAIAQQNLQQTRIKKQDKDMLRPPKKIQKTLPTKKHKSNKNGYKYFKICEICGLHTANLAAHVDSHNDKKVYSCDECGKTFKFRNTLVTHLRVHKPDYVPKSFTCDVCGTKLVSPSRNHISRHMSRHLNERKYACDSCDKRFNDADVLKVHKLIHTDERPFACSECGKTFRTSGCVSRHRRIVHKIFRKVQ